MSPALWGLFLPVLVAYGGTLKWVWDSWNHEESYYAHGPLVVLAGLFVVWTSRARWSVVGSGLDRRGWWLLGPALFLHLAGAALTIDSLSAASLCVAAFGVTWLALGAERLRCHAPVLWLFVFAVPLPMFVTGLLAFELKEIATTAGVQLANLFGLGAQRIGAEIAIPGQTERLLVAAPCSGLRSLVALVTIGYCVAFFFGSQTGARRWVLLFAAVPIAVAVNVLRIAATCWIAGRWGVEVASGTAHDIIGIVVWLGDIALLCCVDACFRARRAT